MKITIIGAGGIGFHLAGLLSKEDHDVTIIDQKESALLEISSNYDVLTVQGSAASAVILKEARVQYADLVIAVTDIDEVNMVACMMSKRLGAKKTIARIRNEEYSREGSPISLSEIGIDITIQPELSTATEIILLIKRSAASDVLELADGSMQLVGLKIDKRSGPHGQTIEEFGRDSVNGQFRIVAIARGGRTIIPGGNDKLINNDQIFFVSESNDVSGLIDKFGLKNRKVQHIMIAGGSSVGEHVLRMLHADSYDYKIKIIDPDEDSCYRLASEYKKSLVLHGNPTDQSLLVSEGVMDMDIFISVTDDEESNIISCLMAKHLGVYKVIAHVSKGEYIPLSQTIGLDNAVNTKYSASNEIHRHVLQGNIHSVKSLHGINAELLELNVGQNRKVVGKMVKNIRFPDGCIVGGIIRNGKSEVATGSSHIEANDELIVFAVHQALEKVAAFFK